jgi:hypothetical protein
VNLFFLCAALVSLPTRRAAAQTLSSQDKAGPGARVLIVHDPEAMENLAPVPERVEAIVNQAITNLTGKTTVSNAWRSLVSTQDTVGIKVFCSPGPNSGTRPAVVAAVVQGLLGAGLATNHIIVWDRHAFELKIAGFNELEQRFGIRVEGAAEAGYDEKVFYDTPLLGTLSWTDREFDKKGPSVGRKSYVSKLVSRQMTKMINIPPMMHHNIAGVSGNLYTLAIGSVDNTGRFENAENLPRAVPEIYALPILGDRVVLNIVDALICQYEGQQQGLLHYSSVLNELRFSRDPVALDVLSLQEIERQRELTGDPLSHTNLNLYSNASLLEIGVSDPRRIQVDRLAPPSH